MKKVVSTPRTELGKRLYALRTEAVTAGMELLSEEEVLEEVKRRLGNVDKREDFIKQSWVQFEYGDDGWWTAALQNVEGAIGQGRTVEEAFHDAIDAGLLLMETEEDDRLVLKR